MVREALDQQALDVDFVVKRDGEQMMRLIEQMDTREIPCPDVVLLDLNLPRRTGLELLARMRESLVCSTVPVIIVTSSPAPNDYEAARRLRATRYFQKPSNYDDFMRLGEMIKEIVRPGRVQ